ncbi:hypothetical protein M0802_001785 [Mischocyttarus mexicanus]|nr:hypothetical protein M0802_001785 [Mischocyttarus mexicanus]
MSEKKPKIIVFDLDYTLWPFWVDTHVTLPFTKSKKNEIVDANGKIVRYYKDVPDILNKLLVEGYELGIASRTSEIKGAKQLLNLFDWEKYFKYKEIYPNVKTAHFSQIKKLSNVEYKDMLFFDDEQRNITDLKKIGVLSILVENGVTHEVINNGLKIFAKS